MARNVLDLNDQNFDDSIKSGVVLIDFYADWCGPCKMMTPVIEEIANEFDGKAKIAKLDIEQSQHTTAKLQITSIPTLMIFKNGSLVEKMIGVQNLDKLRNLLQAHI